MKKLICILLLLCCLTGCTAQAPAQIPEPDFLCAMYIPMGDGYVLIDSDRTPFTLSSVTELTDTDGNALSLSDLSAGDILAIYMPGDMAASYPGILYGYDKLVLQQKGNPADIEQYRDILDSLSMPDNAPPDASLPDELCVNRAMYVPFSDGSYVMIDELGQVYTVRFPADMVGVEGQPITPDDLTAGNILEIYGSGEMLESYPGQYLGVKRIVVVEGGDPSDIEQYRSIIDGLYAVPASQDSPPTLHIEYAIEDAVAYSQVQPGNYSWEQDMGNGEIAAVVACGAHVLQSNGIHQIYIDQPADVLLTFPAYAPVSVTCLRWPTAERRPDGSAIEAEGEVITLDLPVEPAGASGSFDPSLCKLTAEPGHVYLITANWTEGSAEYGFMAE